MRIRRLAPPLALLSAGLFACGGQLDDDHLFDQAVGYAGSSASAGSGGSSGAGGAGAKAGASGAGGSTAAGGSGQAGAPAAGQGGGPLGQGGGPLGQGGAPPGGMAGAPPMGQGGMLPGGPGTGGGPGTVSGPACEACIEQVCGGEWAQCQASAQCVQIADCAFSKCIGQPTGGKGCLSNCFAAAGIQLGQGPLPPSGQAFMKAFQCGRESCPGACPSAGGPGGPGQGPGAG